MSASRKVSASAVLDGMGVHTGAPCRLRLEIGDGPGRPRFHFPGWDHPLAPEDLARLPRQARRSTLLGSGRETVRTPEHLLAALLFFSRHPVHVLCDAEELPGMDGSARPFAEALSAAMGSAASLPAWEEYACGLTWEHAWKDGFIRARPSARFRVDYAWEQGPLRQSFRLEGAPAAWREVLPARTFIFHRHWREAVSGTGASAGLLAGAGPDAGLLLAETAEEHAELLTRHPEWRGGPFPLLNQPAWRGGNELARHKILDLLGDLALLDLRLPKLEIEIRNGGHAVNHVLLEKITHG